MEEKGTLSLHSVKRPKKANNALCAVKNLKKRSGLVINSNIKDGAFKEVKRDEKYVKECHFSIEGI